MCFGGSGSDAGEAARIAALKKTPTPEPTTPERRIPRRRRSILGLASEGGSDTLGLPGATPTAKPTLGA